MAQAPRGLGLAEETLLDLGELVGLELLRKRHGLDRHAAPDFRVLAEIHDAHGALAKLFFHLVATEHRLLGACDERKRSAGVRLRAPEDDRFRHLLGARQFRLEIPEFRVVVGHVAERRFGLVELALALEVEREIVEIVHHGVVQRHLAEVVEGHVELALPLEGEAEHARIGADCASDTSLPRSVTTKRFISSKTWPTTKRASGCINCSHTPWPVMRTKCAASRSAATPIVAPAPTPAESRGNSTIR